MAAAKVDSGTSLAEVHDLIVVGSGGVGKSCITVRFLKDEFMSEYDPTIEELYRKNITVDGMGCIVHITDTAGQHEYTSLRDQHLASGKGFLLVFALNEKGTFEEMKQLRERIIKVKDTKKVPIVICANKCDYPQDQWEVDDETINSYTAPLKIPYFQTSAKENIGVTEAFHELVRESRKMAAKAGAVAKKGDAVKGGSAGKKENSKDTKVKKKGGCTIL
ncbi:Ras GTPase [Blyttiomyces sp. JEL0837]|nr:Ras GTPase [Blyttiomyces sp. JEL0837]